MAATYLDDCGERIGHLIFEGQMVGEEESEKCDRTFQSGVEKPDDVED